MNKYDLAAIIMTNGLETDGYVKLSAAQQRELFGANILGRKDVNFDSSDQGTVRVMVSKCFGTDSEVQRFSYEQFSAMLNAQEKIVM